MQVCVQENNLFDPFLLHQLSLTSGYIMAYFFLPLNLIIQSPFLCDLPCWKYIHTSLLSVLFTIGTELSQVEIFYIHETIITVYCTVSL